MSAAGGNIPIGLTIQIPDEQVRQEVDKIRQSIMESLGPGNPIQIATAVDEGSLASMRSRVEQVMSQPVTVPIISDWEAGNALAQASATAERLPDISGRGASWSSGFTSQFGPDVMMLQGDNGARAAYLAEQNEMARISAGGGIGASEAIGGAGGIGLALMGMEGRNPSVGRLGAEDEALLANRATRAAAAAESRAAMDSARAELGAEQEWMNGYTGANAGDSVAAEGGGGGMGLRGGMRGLFGLYLMSRGAEGLGGMIDPNTTGSNLSQLKKMNAWGNSSLSVGGGIVDTLRMGVGGAMIGGPMGAAAAAGAGMGTWFGGAAGGDRADVAGVTGASIGFDYSTKKLEAEEHYARVLEEEARTKEARGSGTRIAQVEAEYANAIERLKDQAIEKIQHGYQWTGNDENELKAALSDMAGAEPEVEASARAADLSRYESRQNQHAAQVSRQNRLIQEPILQQGMLRAQSLRLEHRPHDAERAEVAAKVAAMAAIDPLRATESTGDYLQYLAKSGSTEYLGYLNEYGAISDSERDEWNKSGAKFASHDESTDFRYNERATREDDAKAKREDAAKATASERSAHEAERLQHYVRETQHALFGSFGYKGSELLSGDLHQEMEDWQKAVDPKTGSPQAQSAVLDRMRAELSAGLQHGSYREESQDARNLFNAAKSADSNHLADLNRVASDILNKLDQLASKLTQGGGAKISYYGNRS